eukprot:COSAG01_NODE_50529_length_362_cov_2.102662_1_plen_75_part_00
MPKKAKSKSKKPVERVLVAGITPAQDELLRTVQYRIGTLGGRNPCVRIASCAYLYMGIYYIYIFLCVTFSYILL